MQRRQGCDQDDVSLLATAHGGQHGVDGDDGTFEVGFELATRALERLELALGSVAPELPRVGDCQIDRATRFDRCHERAHCHHIGDVEGLLQYLCAAHFTLSCDVGEQIGTTRHQRQPPPGRRIGKRQCPTEAPAGSGNDHGGRRGQSRKHRLKRVVTDGVDDQHTERP